MKLHIITEASIECSQPLIGNRGEKCDELGRDCPFIRLKIHRDDGYTEHYKVYVTDISYARMIYNKINGPKFPMKNSIGYIKKLEKNGVASMVKLLDRSEAHWPRYH